MVHSFLKRILKMQKTLRILHPSSSFEDVDDGDSQMVKVMSMKLVQQQPEDTFLTNDVTKKNPIVFNTLKKKESNPTTTSIVDVESPPLTTTSRCNHNNSCNNNNNDANDIWNTKNRRRHCHESNMFKICSTMLSLFLLILCIVLLTLYFRQSHMFSFSNNNNNNSNYNSTNTNSPSHLNSYINHHSNSNNNSNKRINNTSTIFKNMYVSAAKTKPHSNTNRHHHNSKKHNGHSNSADSSKDRKKVDLKTVSRLSWDMLNGRYPVTTSTTTEESNIITISHDSSSNQQHHQGKLNITLNSNSDIRFSQQSRGDDESRSELYTPLSEESEVILPSVIYTSGHPSSNGEINFFRTLNKNSHQGDGSKSSITSKRSCCRTQKYTQTVKVEGCETINIVNKMCYGKCVSVWLPGLFASFPVCTPSKITTRIVTLNCGQGKTKKVKIEKVRRCSCMEITNN